MDIIFLTVADVEAIHEEEVIRLSSTESTAIRDHGLLEHDDRRCDAYNRSRTAYLTYRKSTD